MPLRTNVAERENRILGYLLLNAKVVLLRVLRSQLWLQLSEEDNGPESGPVSRRAVSRIENGAEGIRNNPCLGGLPTSARQRRAALQNEGRAEKSLRDRRATAEWRLGLELFQYQLFDRVIEDPES